jgi:hypothetical protein
MNLAPLKIHEVFLVIVHEEENDMSKDDINRRTEGYNRGNGKRCVGMMSMKEESCRKITPDHGVSPESDSRGAATKTSDMMLAGHGQCGQKQE